MALEPVGVQAVIGNLNGFLSGLSKMDSAMQATGRAADSMAKKASNIGGQFMNLGKSVLGVGAIMGGVALGGAVALGAGFVALGKDALGVIASHERMSASIQALTAREFLNLGVTQDFNKAMEMSIEPTKNVLKWIEKLAIQSPFDAEGVTNAYRTAVAYGFAGERAEELTEAMINFSAATGGTTDTMQRIALALGQVEARGKLSGQELNQLSEAGLNARAVIEKLGYSMDDTTKVPVDEFIQGVIDEMNIFKGAAEAQSTTWAGLMNSLGDIKNIALREFFTGIYEAIKPFATTVVATLSSPEFIGGLKQVGDALGTFFSYLLQGDVQSAFSGFAIGLRDLVPPTTVAAISSAGTFLTDLMAKLREFADAIAPYVAKALAFMNEHWEAIKGALIGIGAVLAGSAIVALIAGIGAAIAALATPITAIIAVAALLGAAWAEDWGGIRTTMTKVWDETLKPALEKLWAYLQKEIPEAIEILTTFWNETLLPVIQDVWAFIDQDLMPVLKDLATFLGTTLKKAWGAITDAIQGVIKWIDDFIEKIKNIKLPDWLTPGSPTPFEIGLLGISKAARLAAEGIEKLGKKLEDLNIGRVEDLLGMAGGFSAFGSAAATMFKKKTLDPLQQRIDEIDARIKQAQEIAAANQDNWVGIAVEREIVRLEEEKLRLAGEYRREQERITALEEQQQKLAFLRSQLDFVKMIRDEGLNLGEILGGLKLGVDADMGGLIDAMTRAMQELIGKAQDELQLHSPSKVFANIGRNIMAGLTGGILSTIDNPIRAMRQSVGALMQAPTMAAAPVLASTSMTFNNQIATPLDMNFFEQKMRQIVRNEL